MKKFCVLLVLLYCAASAQHAGQWIVSAPAGALPAKIAIGGTTVLPNGRLITPRGRTIRTAPHPYGLALSGDGTIAVTANSGTNPISLSVIRDLLSDHPIETQIPPGSKTDKGILASVFMGIAVSPDNRTVYAAGGQENKIYCFDVQSGAPLGGIDCSSNETGFDPAHGYIGELVLTRDGSRIYAVDQINFRVVEVDVAAKKLVRSIKVGRYPFGITLSPDETSLFIANVGMYEYKLLPSVDAKNLPGTALNYPTSAYLSKESVQGYRNDSADVPGLGEANVPESFSVWKIDLREKQHPRVTAKIKTGILVGQMVDGIPAVGGSSPNSVVATNDFVFVSNGNNDCISVIDTHGDSLVANVFIKPDVRLGKYRGIIPFGLALSPDQRRLYVAESGINAVGVVDVQTRKIIGHIPTGWFPAKVKVTPDGRKLIVTSAKGYGSGPNGGPVFAVSGEGSGIGGLMKGAVSIIDIPGDDALRNETRQVMDNNFHFTPLASKHTDDGNPIPSFNGGGKSPIKYIVFISKENRTYDEIFGQLKNGNGEPSLARYGYGATFSNEKKTRTVDKADVMINHLRLAGRFAIADNFYCDSDHSADGHRWLVNTYPNEWVETSVTAAYGGNRSGRTNSKAPGALSFVGSSGAIYPEDYNEAGSMWEHLERNGKDFFNFGFGLELNPAYAEKAFKYTGVKYVVNYPLPRPLFTRSSKIYATYNMGIPDQFRVDMFLKECGDRWMGTGNELPAVLTIILPNDHGSGERPDDGYPFRESYMADNDLALGRTVEYLSHTPYWKNMAIVVTEDDPQGGVDHVDAHRSVLMVISPFAKKNYVGRQHYSFGSIFKTFWNILGIPYLNQFDAGATDLRDMFTNEPDYTPYNAAPVDVRVFDPQKALDPLDERFNWKAVIDTPVIDDPKDMLNDSRKFDERRKGKE